MRTGMYSERASLTYLASAEQNHARWNHEQAIKLLKTGKLAAASIQQDYGSENAAIARACLFALIDLGRGA